MNREMVEKAFKNGAKIEYCIFGGWYVDPDPRWNWSFCEYRIAGAASIEEAFKNGGDVEVRVRRDVYTGDWHTTSIPNWDWDTQEYRIAKSIEQKTVEQAFADGLTIEYQFPRGSKSWSNTRNPVWDWEACDYRVKDVIETVEVQVCVAGNWHDLSLLKSRDKPPSIDSVYLNLHTDGTYNAYNSYEDAKTNCMYDNSEIGIEFKRVN